MLCVGAQIGSNVYSVNTDGIFSLTFGLNVTIISVVAALIGLGVLICGLVLVRRFVYVVQVCTNELV